MKKILYFLFLLPLVSCNKVNYYEYSFNAEYVNEINGEAIAPFNSVISFYFFNQEKTEIPTQLKKEINDLVQYYHALFDRHYNYLQNESVVNNLKVINDSYGSGNKVFVTEELFEILELSLILNDLTQGYFNIGIGQASLMWQELIDNVYDNLDLPNQDQISAAKNCIPSPSQLKEILILDESDNSIIFNQLPSCNSAINYYGVRFDKVSLTLGAIGKGYAVEKIKQHLASIDYFDVEGVLISGGGSSIATYGQYKGTNKWPISLRDALKPSTLVADIVINKENYAIATSGVYQQGIIYKNELYHHIINPFTAIPEVDHGSISIVGDDNALLDALTTALMSMSLEEGRELINQLNNTKIKNYSFGELKAIYQTEINYTNNTSDIYFLGFNKGEYAIDNKSSLLKNHRYFVDNKQIKVKPFNQTWADIKDAILPVAIALAIIAAGLIFGAVRKKNESKN